jgi:hypothetical protein
MGNTNLVVGRTHIGLLKGENKWEDQLNQQKQLTEMLNKPV